MQGPQEGSNCNDLNVEGKNQRNHGIVEGKNQSNYGIVERNHGHDCDVVDSEKAEG